MATRIIKSLFRDSDGNVIVRVKTGYVLSLTPAAGGSVLLINDKGGVIETNPREIVDKADMKIVQRYLRSIGAPAETYNNVHGGDPLTRSTFIRENNLKL